MVPEDAPPRPIGTHHEKDLSGECLSYDHAGDQANVLNGLAREIYLLCDGTRTTGAIARLLPERFDVDEAAARRDVAAAVGELVEEGLLTV
ncbi:MAG: PqqD family protein [Acidobacteriia bacterium]|nr:PqqD family protein [Terriglobia bacterium]